MTTVTGPDGSTFEFPDTTPTDTIHSVLSQHYGGQQPDTGSLPATTTAPAQPALSPPSGTGTADPIMRGLRGAIAPIVGASQLAAHGYNAVTGGGEAWRKTSDDLATWLEEQKVRDKQAAGIAPDSIDWANTAGNIASPVNFVPGAGLAGRSSGLARAAIEGAAISGMQPVATQEGDSYAAEKLKQAAIGAGTGAGGTALLKGAGAAISPQWSPQVNELLDKGVKLTPGQIAGGAADRLEAAAQSFPLVGSWIRGARQGTLGDLNTAAANDVLAPIGAVVDKGIKPGHDLAQHVSDKVSAAYDAALTPMYARLDQPLDTSLQQVVAAAPATLPPAQLQRLQAIIDTQIHGKLAANGGVANGDLLKGIQSELGAEARGYMRSGEWDNQKLGQAIGAVKSAFETALERQNPAQAPALRAANQAYAGLLRLNAASASAPAAMEGVFSGAQLARAAKTGQSKGATARGQNMLQGLGESAAQVLPSKVADSGTPERLASMAMLGGAGAAGVPVPAILAAAAAPLLYSQTGQAVIRTLMTRRPDLAPQVRGIIQRYAPQAAARLQLLEQGKQQ